MPAPIAATAASVAPAARDRPLLRTPAYAAENGIATKPGRFRTKRVRIHPRRVSVLELVPDQPPVIQRLQMVAGRGLAVPGGAARKEVCACVQHRRPRRADAGREIEPGRERGKR